MNVCQETLKRGFGECGMSYKVLLVLQKSREVLSKNQAIYHVLLFDTI